MLIVSKIERPGGTRVEFPGVVYHFKPRDDDPRHVAEVETPAHIRRFLEVREGFEAADAEEEAAFLAEMGAPEGPEARLEAAVATQGAAPDDPEIPDDPQARLEVAVEPGDDELEDLDDAGLAVAYRDALGEKPHPNAKRETLITKIRQARAASEKE